MRMFVSAMASWLSRVPMASPSRQSPRGFPIGEIDRDTVSTVDSMAPSTVPMAIPTWASAAVTGSSTVQTSSRSLRKEQSPATCNDEAVEDKYKVIHKSSRPALGSSATFCTPICRSMGSRV